MRFREAVREGWRDVVAGAGSAAFFAILTAIVLGGIVGVRATGVVAEVRAAHEFVAVGGATTVVRAAHRIDGRACDALVDIPSVRAAGALREHIEGTVPSALPRTSVPTYDVTVGFGALLSPTGSGGAGVFASRPVADELGLETGDILSTATGVSRVSAVYDHPDDGRDPELEYAFLAPAVDDGRSFDACWATIWPQDDDATASVRRVVLPSTGAEGEERVATGQLNPRHGTRFAVGGAVIDANAATVASFAAGVVIGGIAALRRRLSIASDRHVGVTIAAQLVGTTVQHVVWAVVGGVATFASVVVLIRGLDGSDAGPVLLEATVGLAVGIVGAVVGGALGLVSIRERALHRYFRTR